MENFNGKTDKDLENEDDNGTENTTLNDSVESDFEEKNNTAVTVESFLTSLEKIQSSDISPQPEQKKKKKMGAKVRIALLIVLGTIFIVSAYMIASNLIEGFSANKLYNDMNEEFFADNNRTDLVPKLQSAVLDVALPKYGNPRTPDSEYDYQIIETNNQFFEEFKEKLLKLKEQNSDVYGWIQVDGTNISYPCVKGVDNNFYLDHTVTKEYNANGAIFGDSKCKDKVLENQNLVFYGHNSIYPGQMFHELTKFIDKSFFNNNRFVTIYTLDGVYRYEIFSFYETYSTYRYSQVSFVSDNSFVNWCNEMKENSIHEIEVPDFNTNSKILTLSTCTNGYFTRRYSLQARLVSVEK